MIFETERLILRPWEDSDAKDLFELAKDPKVGPMAGWPVHTSVDNSLEIIRDVLSKPETYAVVIKGTNKVAGSVGLFDPCQRERKINGKELEVGYWIGVPYWGNGYIPEAVRRLQKYAFEDLKIDAMWCGFYEKNDKSRRCQEKCGFKYDHTEYEVPCPMINETRTEIYTRITKKEWEKKTPFVLYIHGMGGSSLEAAHYEKIFPSYFVEGLDYKTNSPWETSVEIEDKVSKIKEAHDKLIIIANSIGAYYTLNSDTSDKVDYSFFISPVVDMESMIKSMMERSQISEDRLEAEKKIEIEGTTLSWDYLTFVRNNPLKFKGPIYILCGENDQIVPFDTIEVFASRSGSSVDVMPDGEHWFHTDEQMKYLDKWICCKVEELRRKRVL